MHAVKQVISFVIHYVIITTTALTQPSCVWISAEITWHQKGMLASTFLFFDGFQTVLLVLRSHATVL
jgi:hypothetical protein